MKKLRGLLNGLSKLRSYCCRRPPATLCVALRAGSARPRLWRGKPCACHAQRVVAPFLALALAFTPMASAYAADWFVATNGTGGGTDWANATNSIQGAIDASSAGETVWVSNGVYETGGVTNYPAGTVLTNRVAIYKAITVRSKDNDPTNTIIKGYGGSPIHGSNSVRCVFMTNGASLIGFTVTNGATLTNMPSNASDRNGGGIWSQSTNTVISNCLLTGNAGVRFGGGAYLGTLYNCTLSANLARYSTEGYSYGAGAYGSTLYNCTVIRNGPANQGAGVYGGILYNCTVSSNSSGTGPYGGGAIYATLYNCTLTYNYSGTYGGGAYGSTLYNCILSTNYGAYGGGANGGTLYNCMLSSNSAYRGAGAMDSTLYNCTVSGNRARAGDGNGGGVYGGRLNNSIVYLNTAPAGGSNWLAVIAFTNTCTAPEATNGPGNIASDPLFVNGAAGNYRLNEVSPAINAGTYFAWMTDLADARSKDLDGNNRRDNYRGQVDMGCYEYFFRGTIFTGR